jgi:hypothetical protein
MMALERYTFGFAGNTFPASTSTGQSALHDLDRVVFELLDYYAASLDIYLGSRWTQDATTAGLTPAQAASLVGYKVPYDPLVHLQEDATAFPLLALYRGPQKFSRETSAWMMSRATLSLDWAMPPLTSAQAEQLVPYLQAVSKVLVMTTELGRHPSYQGGADVYAHAGLQDVSVLDAEPRNLIDGSNMVFPAVHLTIQVTERQMPVPGAFQPIAGVDVALDVKADDGTTLPDAVDLTITP